MVAGILGRSKFQFDIWGQTVNIASWLESNAPVNSILVSKSFVESLKGHYEFSAHESKTFKGVGQIDACILERPTVIISALEKAA